MFAGGTALDSFFKIGFVGIVIAIGGYTLGSGFRRLRQSILLGLLSVFQGLFITLLLPVLNEAWRPPQASPVETSSWLAIFAASIAVAVWAEPWLVARFGSRTVINLGFGLLCLAAAAVCASLPPARVSGQLCAVAFALLLGIYCTLSGALPLLRGNSLDDPAPDRASPHR